MNILDAIRDPKVFGEHFRGDTWDAWRAFLCALFALPMTDEQLALYQKHTGRSTPPPTPLRESWLCCGRRSGKSFMLACVAVFLAAFEDWRPFLGPGEIGTVMIIAADRRQSRVIMRYCLRPAECGADAPAADRGRDAREHQLAQSRRDRGAHREFQIDAWLQLRCVLCDEIAYWPVGEDSAAPDVEVLSAIRPSMSTIPGSDAVVRVVTVCAAGCTVGRAPQALRPGRRCCSGMAGCDA